MQHDEKLDNHFELINLHSLSQDICIHFWPKIILIPSLSHINDNQACALASARATEYNNIWRVRDKRRRQSVALQQRSQ